MHSNPPLQAGFLGALAAVLLMLVTASAFAEGDEAHYKRLRLEMVEDLAVYAQEAAGVYTDQDELDPRVMASLQRVPRHRFVPEDERQHAYENRPLPIGHGQTISQPYIVALMTDLLDVTQQDTVLEIGTGSGYQAAVLAELVRQVYTIEIIEPLGKAAGERLRTSGYGNVSTRIADGYYGWEEHAPFDAIIVTAAASSVPPPLVQQLKPGGKMAIPVGSAFFTQQLMLVEKDAHGAIKTQQILPVRFVPLTRGQSE